MMLLPVFIPVTALTFCIFLVFHCWWWAHWWFLSFHLPHVNKFSAFFIFFNLNFLLSLTLQLVKVSYLNCMKFFKGWSISKLHCTKKWPCLCVEFSITYFKDRGLQPSVYLSALFLCPYTKALTASLPQFFLLVLWNTGQFPARSWRVFHIYSPIVILSPLLAIIWSSQVSASFWLQEFCLGGTARCLS